MGRQWRPINGRIVPASGRSDPPGTRPDTHEPPCKRVAFGRVTVRPGTIKSIDAERPWQGRFGSIDGRLAGENAVGFGGSGSRVGAERCVLNPDQRGR